MNSSTSNSKIRKYIIGLLLFVLVLLGLDRGLFYLFDRVEKSYYTYSLKGFEKQFEKYVRDKNFETLIFGTSRTYEGIHPQYMKKYLDIEALKDAHQGKGPKNNLYFYRLYKKHCGVPKVVIYGVDYFIYTVKSDQKWMSRFDLEKEDIEKTNYLTTPLLLVNHKQRIDIFLNGFLVELQDKKEDSDPIRHMDKVQKYIGGPHEPDKVIAKRPKGKFKRQLWPRPPGNEGKFFFKLLEELRKDNVTVLFVLLPDHIGTFKTNIQRDRFLLDMKRLREKYGNIHIYNYNRPRRFHQERTGYFLDGGYGNTNSHLSDQGARVFNEILCRDIKKHFE